MKNTRHVCVCVCVRDEYWLRAIVHNIIYCNAFDIAQWHIIFIGSPIYIYIYILKPLEIKLMTRRARSIFYIVQYTHTRRLFGIDNRKKFNTVRKNWRNTGLSGEEGDDDDWNTFITGCVCITYPRESWTNAVGFEESEQFRRLSYNIPRVFVPFFYYYFFNPQQLYGSRVSGMEKKRKNRFRGSNRKNLYVRVYTRKTSNAKYYINVLRRRIKRTADRRCMYRRW